MTLVGILLLIAVGIFLMIWRGDMTTHRVFAVIIAALLVMMMAGCGRAPSRQPAPVPYFSAAAWS